MRDYGYATGLANWFRAIPDLQARGRIPLVDSTPKTVARLARASARGRIVSVLEGGYNLDALAASVEAHLRALME